MKKLNLIWQRFWRIMVIEEDTAKKETRWKCKCDCGNIVVVQGGNLKNWHTQSCWCLLKEAWIQKRTHFMTNTNFYAIFSSLKARCYNINNKRYKNYWWRGIKCLRKSFEEFRNDMYESYLEHISKNIWCRSTSIDREDNNWDYCKENCRRSTMKQQSNNKSNNRMIEYNWEIKNLMQRSNETWIDFRKIHYRIKQWRDIDKVFTK